MMYVERMGKSKPGRVKWPFIIFLNTKQNYAETFLLKRIKSFLPLRAYGKERLLIGISDKKM